jgi:FtsH-binding integral membrane protein
MTVQRPRQGDVLDELIQNPRRLRVANSCLGIAAAFVYWVRPGTFTPHLAKYTWFKDPSPIFLTVVAWMPYLIAYFVSKAVLADRNPKSVYAYVGLASVITFGASGLFLNLFGMYAPISPMWIAIGVTLALLAAVGLCTLIWRSDASSDDSSSI